MGARIIIITPPNVNAPLLAPPAVMEAWVKTQLETAAAQFEDTAHANTYTYDVEPT